MVFSVNSRFLTVNSCPEPSSRARGSDRSGRIPRNSSEFLGIPVNSPFLTTFPLNSSFLTVLLNPRQNRAPAYELSGCSRTSPGDGLALCVGPKSGQRARPRGKARQNKACSSPGTHPGTHRTPPTPGTHRTHRVPLPTRVPTVTVCAGYRRRHSRRLRAVHQAGFFLPPRGRPPGNPPAEGRWIARLGDRQGRPLRISLGVEGVRGSLPPTANTLREGSRLPSLLRKPARGRGVWGVFPNSCDPPGGIRLPSLLRKL